MSKNLSSLPSRRAFVVQLHRDAKVEHGEWKGRVEHLTSYEAEHFESVEALLAFIARTVIAQEQAEAALSAETDE